MTHTTTRLAGGAAVTLLGLAALTGCGSSSDSASGSSSSAASSSAASSSAAPSSSAAASSSAASPSASSGGSSATKTVKLTIKDYAYSGASKVAPGAKIAVTNDDSEAHTVTADSGSAFDVTIAPGKTAMLTAPSKAGSYAYHCTFHSNMHGKITVG